MRKWAVLAIAATGSAPCLADAVSEVNELAVKVAGPPAANTTIHTLAIANLAMFDAANAVEKRFVAYRPPAPPPAGVNAEGAALAAGCATLAALLPAQKAGIGTTCDGIAARLPAGAYGDDAKRLGESVANDIVAARANVGLNAPNRYRPFTTAGIYVPTPLPVGWDVATAKPLMMTSPSQFRAGPPPALTSETYARDYNEVKAIGARASATRAPEQSATAMFFSPPAFTQFVESIADNAPPSPTVSGRTRYYALVYATLFDVGIALFDAKYAYNFWRPITAIRNGDIDGNPATEPDLGWNALIDAPLHPEYPCAHCNSSAAFGTVVLGLIEPGRRLVLRSGSNPRREYAAPGDLAADAMNARVYSGIHFRFSAEAGAAMGKRLGEYILATQLRPLP